MGVVTSTDYVQPTNRAASRRSASSARPWLSTRPSRRSSGPTHAAADPRHVCPERNAARRQHLGHESRAFPNTPHLVPTPSDGISCCRQIPARCLGPSCHAVDAQHPFCKPCPLPVAGRDCTSCDDTPEPCFPPPCDESSEPAGHTSGLCSGNFNAARVLKSGPVSVVDSVLIPPHLKPGKWVLVSPATVCQPSRHAVA